MNILLTSAGRRSYIVNYFKEALHGDGRVHAGNSVFSPALVAADMGVITPLIYDESYVKFLLDYCVKNDIHALIPLFDVDLPVLSLARESFAERGVHAVVPDYEVAQICNDKWQTFRFLNDHGITAPKTFISLNETNDALGKNVVAFPLIVKPRWGMGSIGINSVDTPEELILFYNKLKKDIFKTYLSFESDHDRERCVIIQEMLRGCEYGLDVVNDLNGNYVTTFVKRKIAMRSGETDRAITEDNSALRELGRCISEKLHHIANLDVDCFVYRDRSYVLEMNCRIGGHYPFAHLAGANLPLAIVKWLKGEEPEEKLFTMEYSVEGAKDINPIRIMRNV